MIAIPIQIGTGVFIATAGANKIMLHQVGTLYYILTLLVLYSLYFCSAYMNNVSSKRKSFLSVLWVK